VKSLVKKTFPDLYATLVKARRGDFVRAIEGQGSRAKFQKLVKQHVALTIDICSPMGFGGALTNLVSIHHFLDNLEVKHNVVINNPLYASASGKEMIDVFFERKEGHYFANTEIFPFDNDFDISIKSISSGLNIEKAKSIFDGRYKIREEYISRIEPIRERLKGALGVHFRGTDKNFEAKRLNWGEISSVVDRQLDRHEFESIYVASDERDFINFMVRRYGSSRVFGSDARHLSDGNVAVHFSPGDGREKGAEALDVILALGQCAYCVRGPSLLSAWAKILNPSLPVTVIGSQFSTRNLFPEDEIRATAELTDAPVFKPPTSSPQWP